MKHFPKHPYAFQDIFLSVCDDKKKSIQIHFRRLIKEKFASLSIFIDDIIEKNNWKLIVDIFNYIKSNKKDLNHCSYSTNYMILVLQESIKSSTNPNIHDALLQYPSIIKYLGNDIKTDETLMKQIVSIKGKYLVQAKFKFYGEYSSFTRSKEMVCIACANDGNALKFAIHEFRSDPDVVYIAVSQNGLALKFSGDNIRSIRDIIIIAVRQNGLALKYASPDLQDDKEIVDLAIRQNGNVFQYASHRLKCCNELILKAIYFNCNKRYLFNKKDHIRENFANFLLYNKGKNYDDYFNKSYEKCVYISFRKYVKDIIAARLVISCRSTKNIPNKLNAHGPYHAINFKKLILSCLFTPDICNMLINDIWQIINLVIKKPLL